MFFLFFLSLQIDYFRLLNAQTHSLFSKEKKITELIISFETLLIQFEFHLFCYSCFLLKFLTVTMHKPQRKIRITELAD